MCYIPYPRKIYVLYSLAWEHWAILYSESQESGIYSLFWEHWHILYFLTVKFYRNVTGKLGNTIFSLSGKLQYILFPILGSLGYTIFPFLETLGYSHIPCKPRILELWGGNATPCTTVPWCKYRTSFNYNLFIAAVVKLQHTVLCTMRSTDLIYIFRGVPI